VQPTTPLANNGRESDAARDRHESHCTFTEVVFWQVGWLRWYRRIDMTSAGLDGFGRRLTKMTKWSSRPPATRGPSLHAAGVLSEVGLPDADFERLRRLVARRNQIVPNRTRLKNAIHPILAAHLTLRCPHAELFNGAGRAWLARQVLPDDERAAIERHLR
jgi:transposase